MLHVGGSDGGLSIMRARSYPIGVMASAPLQMALSRMDSVLTATTTVSSTATIYLHQHVCLSGFRPWRYQVRTSRTNRATNTWVLGSRSTGSVSLLLTRVHERKEFLIERLTSLEADQGSGQQFSQWPEEAR